ncbi:MAG TPA: hypothetical protein VF283_18545 [Bryobacteraceae bacterium]
METRREFLQGGSPAAVAAFAGQAVSAQQAPPGQHKPNILFILTEPADALSIAGNRILHTPKLDRIAQEGASFQNAFLIIAG